jgi:ferric-dicitrate binding protein FerR (iron transport regulator)
MTKEEAWELLVKKLAHKISEDESKSLERWVNTDKENGALMEEMTQVWYQTTQETDASVFDNQKAWNKVVGRVHPTPKVKVIDLGFARWSLAAACLAGLIAVGYLLSNKSSRDNNTRIIVKTMRNEKRAISLPDSSKVWLNENSELNYDEAFLKDSIRTVTLNGEAFFEVSHDPMKPFIVQGNGLVTRVLGTSFNLKYTDTQKSLVVVTGKVRFSYLEKTTVKGSIIVEAGYQTELHDSGFVNILESDKNKLAWHTGVLEFRNESLDEVVQNLTGLYNAPIALKVADQKRIKYTGVIDHLPIEVALETICFPLDLQWKQTADGYLISNN